ADVLGLIRLCDAYVSLHRAEGFGYTLAEAMALERPVVATYYSGNVDFMTPWNSFPVPYRLAEIPEDRGRYAKGRVWADPDLAAAADLMRAVFTERERAAEVALRVGGLQPNGLGEGAPGVVQAARPPERSAQVGPGRRPPRLQPHGLHPLRDRGRVVAGAHEGVGEGVAGLGLSGIELHRGAQPGRRGAGVPLLQQRDAGAQGGEAVLRVCREHALELAQRALEVAPAQQALATQERVALRDAVLRVRQPWRRVSRRGRSPHVAQGAQALQDLRIAAALRGGSRPLLEPGQERGHLRRARGRLRRAVAGLARVLRQVEEL